MNVSVGCTFVSVGIGVRVGEVVVSGCGGVVEAREAQPSSIKNINVNRRIALSLAIKVMCILPQSPTPYMDRTRRASHRRCS